MTILNSTVYSRKELKSEPDVSREKGPLVRPRHKLAKMIGVDEQKTNIFTRTFHKKKRVSFLNYVDSTRKIRLFFKVKLKIVINY